MKSFLNNKRPLITPLLKSTDKKGLLEEIRKNIDEGADAFGLQIEGLARELRTEEVLTELFRAMGDRPIYVTCYKRWDVVDESEEDRVETLLTALRCGATLIDVRGDLYDPQDGDMTYNRQAVKKQKQLVKKIHDLGGEVIISAHVATYADNVFSFLSSDQVLKIAQTQVKRGADIAKVVIKSDTEEELTECFKTSVLLLQKLDKPALFVCNGKNYLRHRVGAPIIGAPFVLTKASMHKGSTSPQATTKEMVQVFSATESVLQ